MTLFNNQRGFSPLIAILIVVVLTGLGGAGYYVWNKNKDDTKNTNTSQNNKDEDEDPDDDVNTAENWVAVTTVNGRLGMKVPDGWTIVRYPGDYLGSTNILHTPGMTAVIETSTAEYTGHSLQFRASITPLDDAGLGPQWASPQPGLSESTQSFSLGMLQGKRYKAVFSEDIDQTLYEYVFDLGGNEKLDILYVIDHSKNEPDNVGIIEKAIKTITIK